jgi:hypothetical protein
LYFRISSQSVELIEPDDVTSFHAVCPAGLGYGALAEIVQKEDLGEILPAGGHLMVPLGTVRRMAAGRVGPDWEQKFDAMVAYAARKGWLSEDGTKVRAHLEAERV